MNNYDDIINLNRPISKHKHMTIEERSAQFAPFAALVGYDSAVKETARLTENKKELNDEQQDMLNFKLRYLYDNINNKNEVTITHFVKDIKKVGGKYINTTGIIKQIDQVQENIKLNNNVIIYMNDIINITGDIFNDII